MNTYGEYRAAMENERINRLPPERLDWNRAVLQTHYPMWGLRTPFIKKLANSVSLSSRESVLDGFYADTDIHYETVLFAAVAACKKGDYAATLAHLKRIIPMFDCWAFVDCMCSSLNKTAPIDVLLNDFAYLKTEKSEFSRRVYCVLLMGALDDKHIDFALEEVANTAQGDYYVDMALAWVVAEALVKQYDKAAELVKSGRLSAFVHNKGIQKARESYRISLEQKAALTRLKRPKK